MGQMRDVPPAALIAGLTFATPGALDEAMRRLAGSFGPVEMESPVFAFDMTGYYHDEMGGNLEKRFLCFREPVDRGALSSVKLATNGIERELARPDSDPPRRTVNIDPGYVTLSKLVLASTKDYSHRIYVGGGVFAETTLRFVRGTFAPIDTTYPDYRTPLAIDFFNSVRDFVKRNRQAWIRKNASKS